MAPPAAAAAQAPPQELQLVFQNSAITFNCSTVCTLLCVSKGVQSAVANTLHLQLSVELEDSWTDARIRSFAAFARKFSTLLGGLIINIDHSARLKPITAALMFAAVQPQGLQLRSLAGIQCVASNVELMCLLPLLHKTLTRLHWSCRGCLDYYSYQPEDPTHLVFSALTNLHSLTLGLYTYGDGAAAEEVWSAVSGIRSLTSLTALQLSGPWDLQHLPAQLQQLCFGYSGDNYSYGLLPMDAARDNRLQLTHMTALTKLGTWEIGYPGDILDWSCHVLESYDLPPISLRQATFHDIESVHPLLKLTNLQGLTVLSASTAASELLQLSRVSNLTSLSYSTDRSCEVASTVALNVMSALPTAGLHLTNKCLPAGAVEALGELTALTSLTLDGCSAEGATALGLAMVLSRLTRLQELTLVDMTLATDKGEWWSSSYPSDADILLLCEAITKLKQLRLLAIHMPLTAEAAYQLQDLGTATQLTCLQLNTKELSDAPLAPLLAALPNGLRHLDLGEKTQIAEGSLAILGEGLPHLTQLEVGCVLPWVNESPVGSLSG